MKNISEIASKLNIENIIEKYGENKAKINFDKVTDNNEGRLILVTATSPTPYGEGKTTISIGLLDALCSLNKKAVAALREPSLGPVFGIKGGATGGGASTIVPSNDINLHFTGDFSAIEKANNLICAAIDNHIYQGNELSIANVVFNRCMDMNDRALKNITINSKYSRPEAFDITAASEIMAILCLAQSIDDLRKRIDNIIFGTDTNSKPLYVKELNVTGSVMALLSDAIKPNLVQTSEENPVIIHGGPFANIAHGCSSIIATNTALKIADYVVTEAGFGSDLGALKFFDIKCRNGVKKPDVVVITTTIKALEYNGTLDNLKAHIDITKNISNNIIVCLNKFDTDTESDINLIKDLCEKEGVLFTVSTNYVDGGQGTIDLANKVIELTTENHQPDLYDLNDTIDNKVTRIIKDIYKASNVWYSEDAREVMEFLKKNNLDKLPICIAKTQYSISDDPQKLGYPTNYTVTIKDMKIYNGAGFITIYLGDIITMPGLPKNPNYEKIDYINGEITGIN